MYVLYISTAKERVQLYSAGSQWWCSSAERVMAGIVAGKVRKARERDAKEEGGHDKGRQLVGESL